MDEPEKETAVDRGGRCWMICVLLELVRRGSWVIVIIIFMW